MSPYEQLAYQLPAYGVILAVALRVIWTSRRERAAHKAEFDRRMAELAKQREEILAAVAVPCQPSVLRVTLDLREPEAVADIGRVARDTEPLLAGISGYEEAMGGRGFILTGAKAERGQVILTLTPRNADGSTDRVKRVADALNAAFDADSPKVGASPDLGSLPANVSEAHAVATFAA